MAKHRAKAPDRAVLLSMGIDPGEYARDLTRAESGRTLEEMYGSNLQRTLGDERFWLPGIVWLEILVSLHGRRLPEGMAATDLAGFPGLTHAQYAARWGWSPSQARRFVGGGSVRPTRPGVIYAISTADPAGLVKLGFTVGAPEARLRSLQTGSPVALVLLDHVAVEGQHAERALHVALREHRRHGEWFERGPALAALVKLRGGPP